MSGTLMCGGISLITGLWFVLRAFRLRTRRVSLLRNCVRVSGTIIRLEETTTEGDVLSTYSPVLAYQACDGRSYETTLLPQQDRKRYRIGTKLPIFYHRDEPQHAVPDKRMWDVNLACLLSVVPLLIDLGLIVTAYQDAAEQARLQ